MESFKIKLRLDDVMFLACRKTGGSDGDDGGTRLGLCCEVCIGLHFLPIVHYNDCGCKNCNNTDCGSN